MTIRKLAVTCPKNVNVPAPCIPNWTVDAWGACQPGNYQTRTVTDTNGCGTTSGRPTDTQYCCYPVWGGGTWGACQPGNVQYKTETDGCGNSRIVDQYCCYPVWQCELPLNGYMYDGCGNRTSNSSCNPPTPANIICTGFSAGSISPNTIRISGQFQNTGGTSGSFVPLVIVDGISYNIGIGSINLSPGGIWGLDWITLSSIPAGTHTANLYPSNQPSQTVSVVNACIDIWNCQSDRLEHSSNCGTAKTRTTTACNLSNDALQMANGTMTVDYRYDVNKNGIVDTGDATLLAQGTPLRAVPLYAASDGSTPPGTIVYLTSPGVTGTITNWYSGLNKYLTHSSDGDKYYYYNWIIIGGP